MRASRIVVAVIVLVTAAVTVVAAGASPRTDLATVAAPDSTSIALRYAPTWLPDGFVERTRSLSTAKGDRAASYSRQWGTRPIDDERALYITLGTKADVPPNGDTSYVVVEVRPGLLLTVHHWWPRGTPLPATELSKMADRIRVSTPDMSWIGTRQL